ncbi:MAG: pseudouridine synthase, partial [Oscillospiraceae bacterium]|nr:pseudouridine synthase [Oscillospiraceae bacterium]
MIDKPESWTSNDVVQKLRGILHEKRIGHAGTLDPMATGLLTVFVGRATRAVEFAEGDRKRYLAGLRLGLTTDTQDITGEVLGQCEAGVSREALEEALQAFRGEIRQTPPMYSAVKVNGRRL